MKLERFPFYSKELKTEHIVRVYFPDDYKERRFPFLLVQDGLCAFRRDTPIEWECFSFDNALETVDKKMVIIAIEAKEWQDRTKEYSPYPWVGEAEHWLPKGEEKGDRYANWILNELLPYLSEKYHLSTKREDHYLYGTSLGALISVYLFLKRPDSFSKVGACSLASWGNEEALLKQIAATDIPLDSGFFVRVGEEEGVPRDLVHMGACYPKMAKDFVDALKKKGLANVDFASNPRRAHKTIEWEKDVPSFLSWL